MSEKSDSNHAGMEKSQSHPKTSVIKMPSPPEKFDGEEAGSSPKKLEKRGKIRGGDGKKAGRNEGKKRGFFAHLPRTPQGILASILLVFSFWLILSLSLVRVWPDGWGFVVGPGIFLSRSFSWAAYFIPVWGICAAILALVPTFMPRTIYLLGAVVLPFLVLAAFARLSTEPGAFFENHPIFAAVGLSSLYAALGFLLASSIGFVMLGFFKMTEWLRANGTLPEKKSSAKARSALGAPSDATSGENTTNNMVGFVRQKPLDILKKLFARPKTKAEKRLRRSEDLAIDPFGLDFPELPVIEGLKTVSNRQDNSRDPGRNYSRGEAAGELLDDIPRISIRQESGAAASAEGIEFTSVPPQKVLPGAASTASDGDAQKKALVSRILDRKKEKPYMVPVDGILNTYPDGQYWIIDDKTRRSAVILKETLAEFNIQAEVTGIRKGPVITMFEILPAPGVKISKITNLSDNIALRLAASSVRIVAPIPGKHAVGIEVPNERRAIVSLREIIEHEQFRSAKMEIPVALGKDIAGEVQFIDLTQTPHLLIAGATGSGKSVCVNSIILSILYRRTPEEVKLLLIDPKIVELKLYNDIPHLLTPVVTEAKKAFQALQYCICEMERRYSMLDKAGVRDVKSYNRRVKERNLAQERLPYIVVIIDEFADLMATTGKELEATLARLAAMSRAVGIHLVLATQRPSIDVITGLIKANIPSRIAFMVASKFDSRIIIDMVGAEKLLGRGDMLFSGAQDPFPVRMQGTFVSEEEVERAVEHVKTLGEPEYIDDEIFYDEDDENSSPGLFDDGDGDPLFEKALEIVMQQGKASASFIQRRLKIGYNRSARLVELMEERGIVGPSQGSKPRDLMRNPDVFSRPDAGRVQNEGLPNSIKNS
jgi:S-DNA-T family DNA segregation ATPase FtsK/SpoIIIE